MLLTTPDFRFESRVTDEQDKKEIGGRLKITISAIKAEGEGKLDITNEMKKFAEDTSCEFFGDYSGITPPLTLAQAKDTILAIEGEETNSNWSP